MSFLQYSTLLPSIGHGKDSRSYPIASRGRLQLRSKASIASLVQLVRNPIQSVGEAVDGWRDGLTREQREQKQCSDDRKQLLNLRLRNATNYDDWRNSATELDDIEGNNAWKTVFESPDYDPHLLQARLRQLDEARISCDVGRMLFLVRTALTRGLGDMGNLKLYKYTHVGTKDLIERYITSALETLDALLDISAKSDCDALESKHIMEQVLSARQAFGRSALLLSGGATFGMNHIGVLKALWEAHLLPRIISGASAGSIVSAVLCTRTDEEMPELLETFCHGDLAVFEEEGNEDSILRKIARFLKFGALFDISHLTRVMKDILGDLTFQEAYNRTRRILNICVSSASLYELPRLLNYITAPNVLIWSAVAASCSVPFIFSAASLLAKDPKTGEAVPWNPSPQRWIDGSVDNDIPMTRLAEMFNVNHFIVSQVNPHVVPFLVKEEESIAQEAHHSSSTVASGPTWLHSITDLAKGEALHRMHVMVEMGIFPNTLTKAVSVLSQKYSGDITIFPEISYADFPRMLSNPTTEFMIQAMLCGERATWPKLSRIRNHCAIELALDDAVQKLRTRVVFSPDQANLRLGLFSRSTSDYSKRQGSKRQRKMSQTSEPDASTAKGVKDGKVHQQTKADGLAGYFNYVKTSKSYKDSDEQPGSLFNVLDRWGTGLANNCVGGEHYQRQSLPSRLSPSSNPMSDILSSEAETYHTTSDAESETSSSSAESPYIPSPNKATFGAHSRHLFPHASQPNTPASDPSTYFSSAPASKPTHIAPSISGSPLTMASLSMTPYRPPEKDAKPSSPELKYRRVFHNAVSKVRPRTSESNVKPLEPKRKRFNALGLEIDISGTTGMALRKKRSE